MFSADMVVLKYIFSSKYPEYNNSCLVIDNMKAILWLYSPLNVVCLTLSWQSNTRTPTNTTETA